MKKIVASVISFVILTTFIPQCYGKTVNCEVVKTHTVNSIIPTIYKPYVLILYCEDVDSIKKLKNEQKIKVKIVKKKLEGC